MKTDDVSEITSPEFYLKERKNVIETDINGLNDLLPFLMNVKNSTNIEIFAIANNNNVLLA